jgi:hypothetical protein
VLCALFVFCYFCSSTVVIAYFGSAWLNPVFSISFLFVSRDFDDEQKH